MAGENDNMNYAISCKICKEIYCGVCAINQLPTDDVCYSCKYEEDYIW
jgi:hypothetical protein